MSGCFAATLQDLNPSLLRLTTPKDLQFELHLPVGTREKYMAAIEPIPPAMRVWWRYHDVAEGDTLASIARTYRTSPQAIERKSSRKRADLPPESKLIIIPSRRANIRPPKTGRATRGALPVTKCVEATRFRPLPIISAFLQ